MQSLRHAQSPRTALSGALRGALNNRKCCPGATWASPCRPAAFQRNLSLSASASVAARAHTHTKQPSTFKPPKDKPYFSAGSYVNFRASRADLEYIMGRLAVGEAAANPDAAQQPLSSPAVPSIPALATTSTTVSQPQSAAGWGGMLGGLLNRLSHGSQDGGSSSSSNGNGQHPSGADTPLQRAVVMFTATWCGPCSLVYDQLYTAVGLLGVHAPAAVLVIDVEAEAELASELGIKVGWGGVGWVTAERGGCTRRTGWGGVGNRRAGWVGWGGVGWGGVGWGARWGSPHYSTNTALAMSPSAVGLGWVGAPGYVVGIGSGSSVSRGVARGEALALEGGAGPHGRRAA